MKRKSILKGLMGAYFLTALLLCLLAFLLFKFDLQERMVGAGITVVYILSCFFGGCIVGKGARQQKYLWGALTGVVYFLLLVGVSCVVERGISMSLPRLITTFALCLGGGMLGGMLA